MTVKIIKHYIILLVMFFSVANFAHASLEITEIMYDPVGSDENREWVKLYNNGDKEIKVIGGQTKAAWRISGGETKESLHYINEDLNISVGGYAVIAKNKDIFKQEYPSFSGPVTTASISFNNTAGEVKIWDGEDIRNIVASREYPASDLVPIEEEVISDNSIDPIPLIKEDPLAFKITTKIISPKVVVAGIPFSLSSLTTTNTGETYAIGNFVWNFGNGMMNRVGESNPFEYTYEYGGEYVLTLSYFSSYFSKVADATDRIIIKVIPAEIYISGVGSDIDPYIEIGNKSNYEIVLSNWVVSAGMHYFIIPNGTTVLAGKKIKLSPKITGFVGEDIKSIVITNQNKEIITTYPIQIKKLAQKVYKSPSSAVNNNLISSDNNSQDESILKDSQIINLNDLGASASEAENNIPNSSYALIGLLVVVGIGVTSFLLIRRKRDVEDYVEKGISAKDMTIIE